MRTYDLELTINVRAVVPEQFTQRMREYAADTGEGGASTEFLRRAVAQFGNDDEGFTLHVVKHGLRNVTRFAAAQAMHEEGIGATLAPAKCVVHTDRNDPPEVPAVLASAVAAAIPA